MMLVTKDRKIILSVKVVSNSNNNEIIGWQGEELKIRVVAPPDKGRANKELIKFLANQLNVANKDIEIINGLASNRKRVLIHSMNIKNFKIIIKN